MSYEGNMEILYRINCRFLGKGKYKKAETKKLNEIKYELSIALKIYVTFRALRNGIAMVNGLESDMIGYVEALREKYEEVYLVRNEK